jgi:hypothetical protein
MSGDDVLYYLTLSLNISAFILDIGTAVIAAYLKGYVGLSLGIIFFGQLCQLPNVYLYLKHLYANDDGVYKNYVSECASDIAEVSSGFFSRGLDYWDQLKYWFYIACVAYSNISRLLVSNLPNLLILVATGYSIHFAFVSSIIILAFKQLSILLNSIETSENWIKEKRFQYRFGEDAKEYLKEFDKNVRQDNVYVNKQYLCVCKTIDDDQFGISFQSISTSLLQFFGLENKEWASSKAVRLCLGVVSGFIEAYLTYLTCQLGNLNLLSLLPFGLVVIVVYCRLASDLVKVFQFNRSRAYDQQAHLLNKFATKRYALGDHFLFGLQFKRHVFLLILFGLMEFGSSLAKIIAGAGGVYLLLNKFTLLAALGIQPIYVVIFVVLVTGLSTVMNAYQRCSMVWRTFIYRELNENPNGMKDELFVDAIWCIVKAKNLRDTITVELSDNNPSRPEYKTLKTFSIKSDKKVCKFDLLHRHPDDESQGDLVIERDGEEIYRCNKHKFSGEDDRLKNLDFFKCPSLLSRMQI